MTASVSSTRPSTFCFFRLGSWGPLPLRGGLTGSLGRLLLGSPPSTPTTVLWSTLLACPRVALVDPWGWSSKSLSSRQTQLLPMVPGPETTLARVSQDGGREVKEEKKSRTCARLLQAQKVIQADTIISFGELVLGGFWSMWAGWGQRKWSCCCRAQIRLGVIIWGRLNGLVRVVMQWEKSSEHHKQPRGLGQAVIQGSCSCENKTKQKKTENVNQL